MKTESFVTLDVGRSYISRNGKVVKIKSQDTHSVYPFNGDNDASYDPNGRWVTGCEDSIDLISRIIKPTTLTIQRWGVLWKSGSKKGSLLISTLNTKLPYTFATRKKARRFAKQGLINMKPVKVRCTYEVIE